MILDGKALAGTIQIKIAEQVKSLPSKPGLAVLLVGDDPASHLYVELKRKACDEVDIHFEKHLFKSDTSEEILISAIDGLNAREDIHGILVQLPLPTQDASRIIAKIDPLKDVDGFHPKNLERLQNGEPAIVSAVALGIMKLIAEVPSNESYKTAVIVSSPLFARPLETLLDKQNIGSSVIQDEDSRLAEKTKSADILIVAEGQPGLINGPMVKPGAIVIDVGTTKIDGKLHGDVDFDSVKSVAGALTPVPGGVGPMTVAMLLGNILKAYRHQNL